MIHRLASFAVLTSSLGACCCPRMERRCCDPCGPSDSGPVVLVNGTATFVEPPPPAPTPSASAPEAATMVLQVHAVSDLVRDEQARMDRLLEKVRVWASQPGSSVAPQGLAALVVKATRLTQALVAGMLHAERNPLRLKYFDVKDLREAHPTLLDDLKPLIGDVEGRTIDLKNGTLIVRASGEVLDEISTRLEALRAPK